MSQAPIFQNIFGTPWPTWPPVMQKHYAIRAQSRDRVVVSGVMNIRCGWLIHLFAPLLKCLGALVPYEGQNIPVTVSFYSDPDGNGFHFDRMFNFPDRKAFSFHSVLEQVSGDEVIEFMRSGLGWRCRYCMEGAQVRLIHRGYLWRIWKWIVPLPLKWVIGKGAAAEEVLSEVEFKMWMTITHPLLDEIYRYEGRFKVVEVTYG